MNDGLNTVRNKGPHVRMCLFFKLNLLLLTVRFVHTSVPSKNSANLQINKLSFKLQVLLSEIIRQKPNKLSSVSSHIRVPKKQESVTIAVNT